MASSQIACLLCNSMFSKGQLYGHISEHFNFHRYRCVSCNFSASFSDEVADHAMEEDHNGQPEDNSLAHPFVHHLINLIASQSRACARNAVAATTTFQALDSCILSYEKQRLLPPVDTQIPCLICDAAVANSEYHIGIKHFSGFVRFRCSNCPFKSLFSNVVVNHALERDHDSEPIDSSIESPYAYRLIKLIVWQSRAAFSDQLRVRVYADLDNLISSADTVALGQDTLPVPALRADLSLDVAKSRSPVLSATVIQESGRSADSGVGSAECSSASSPLSIDDHSASCDSPRGMPTDLPLLPNRPVIVAVKEEVLSDAYLRDMTPPELEKVVRCALCPAGTNGLLASDKEAHVFRHVEESGVPMGSNDAAFFDEVSRVWLMCFPEDAAAEASDVQSLEDPTNQAAEATMEFSEVIHDDAPHDEVTQQLLEPDVQNPEGTAALQDISDNGPFQHPSESGVTKPELLGRRVSSRLKCPTSRESYDQLPVDIHRLKADTLGLEAFHAARMASWSGDRQGLKAERSSQRKFKHRSDTCSICHKLIAAPLAGDRASVRTRRHAAKRRHVWYKHAPFKPCRCINCASSFVGMSDLQRHNKSRHPDAPVESAKKLSQEERRTDWALFEECFPMQVRVASTSSGLKTSEEATVRSTLALKRLKLGYRRKLARLNSGSKAKKAVASSAKLRRPEEKVVKNGYGYVCRVCNTRAIGRSTHVWTRHMDGLKRWTCSVCKASNNELCRLKDKCAKRHPSVASDTEATSDSVQRTFKLAFEQCYAAPPDAFIWQSAKINVGCSENSAKTASTNVRISTKCPQMKRRRTLSPASRGFGCKLCLEEVRCDGNLSDFQRHVSACHLGENNQLFKCSACDFTGSLRENVDRHIGSHRKRDRGVRLIDCSSESFPDKRSCFAACFPDFLHLFDLINPSASVPRRASKLSSKNHASLDIDLPSTSGFQIDHDGSADAEAEGEPPFEGFDASDLEYDDNFGISKGDDSEATASEDSSPADSKPITM